ncbi:MAG: hypothetical protein GF401_11370 [Chitinivibrionales bacterium]|nr:hypothetical protein [Chitinivibrionales bacterium]
MLDICLIVVIAASAFVAPVRAAPPSQGTMQNGIPIAKIGGSKICCPSDTVTLDGWASIDVGGEVVEWYWDLDGNGSVDTVADRGELTFRAPEKPQSYLVLLRVKDNGNTMSLPDSAVLHVMEDRPKVTVGPDTTVQIGTRVFFRPRVACHCGAMVSYEWDLDGDEVFEYHSAKNANTSKAYFRPGKYRTRFRVVNSYGKEAGGIQTITVTTQLPR